MANNEPPAANDAQSQRFLHNVYTRLHAEVQAVDDRLSWIHNWWMGRGLATADEAADLRARLERLEATVEEVGDAPQGGDDKHAKDEDVKVEGVEDEGMRDEKVEEEKGKGLMRRAKRDGTVKDEEKGEKGRVKKRSLGQ
ncbi:hypothetical protein LTR36_004783 [Oleoguttula mirabilis]|uniref:Uncharacterized protein n=1 Tax=Oleoguttula mirabilis TaxID=1507867 RepID=A0AAV9JET4_9PEZI|nr:hypothetical protein LTR36_004783 [Oleoguttula mirabilis]